MLEKPLPQVFEDFKKMIAPLLSSSTQQRMQEVIDR